MELIPLKHKMNEKLSQYFKKSKILNLRFILLFPDKKTSPSFGVADCLAI
jgi:hypothetical protein